MMENKGFLSRIADRIFPPKAEDETAVIALQFEAKSVTGGNQTLKYFKVMRNE